MNAKIRDSSCCQDEWQLYPRTVLGQYYLVLAQLKPAPQRVDTVIQNINHYTMDKYYEKLLTYPVNRDLSN